MYRFVIDEQWAVVHVYSPHGGSVIGSFRMPRGMNTLEQFKERFYSMSPMGHLRVEPAARYDSLLAA